MDRICYRCAKEVEKPLHGLHQECFFKWFDCRPDTEFRDIHATTSQTLSRKFSNINTSFFHGRFKKYAANLGSVAYILKVQEPEYPELPATEYLCTKLHRKQAF